MVTPSSYRPQHPAPLIARANYSLNISLHVLILFSFLTILFFAYISHIEQKTVDDTLVGAIDDQMGQLLSHLDKDLPPGMNVDWKVLNRVAEKIQKETTDTFPEVKKNHHNLLIVGVCMIVGVFAVFSGFYAYYGVYKDVPIHWKRILVENLIVFGCVGIIEFLFFTKVAIKYIPVTPDILSKTILDRIKYRLNTYLDK
jgi:hypothetical protein